MRHGGNERATAEAFARGLAIIGLTTTTFGVHFVRK